MKESLAYGVKVGHYLDRWAWLGIEAELLTSTPHVMAGIIAINTKSQTVGTFQVPRSNRKGEIMQSEGGPGYPSPVPGRDPEEPARSGALPGSTEWTADIPSVPGWFWLRHAVFRTALGQWHEPRPVVVELVPDATGHLLVYVSGTTWTRSVEDLIVGEWSGPLALPERSLPRSTGMVMSASLPCPYHSMRLVHMLLMKPHRLDVTHDSSPAGAHKVSQG